MRLNHQHALRSGDRIEGRNVGSFAQRLRYANRGRFVARAPATRVFDSWLDDPSAPPILGVFGPGGVGKSWLLDEFAARAQARGARVWPVDADRGDTPILPPAPAGMDDAAARRVLLVDGLDALPAAGAGVARELAELDDGVRVVLASRRRLSDGPWRSWTALIRPLELAGFDAEECSRYLDLRGVDDPRIRELILYRSGGHPLTMSLAADLLLLPDVADWSDSAAWSRTVTSAVEQLLADIGGPLREAVQAAAVLGRCDQDTLSAVLGPPAGARAFVRLCGLSVCRAIGDEVALHDEVRAVVLEDLRLHRPALLDAFRRRALRHLRRHPGGRSAATVAARRGGLHLLGRELPGYTMLEQEYRDIVVTVGTEADLDDVLALRRRVAAEPGLPAVEAEPALLAPVLADPDCEVHLARASDGTPRGYAFHLRLNDRTRALLAFGAMPEVLDAALHQIGCDRDPPERSNIYFLSTIVTVDADPRPVSSALGGSVIDLMLAEGAYLMVPAAQPYRAMAAALHAEPLTVDALENGVRLDPWLLDLSRYGVEAWALAVAGGTAGALALGEELQAAVAQAVSGLDDDRVLAASPLVRLAEPDDDRDIAARALAVRELLSRAIAADGVWPTPDLRVRDALRAAGIDALPDLGGAADPDAEPIRRAEPLRLQLLGDFVLRRGEVSVPVPHGVLSTLVKIVALRRRIPADELVEWLWPAAPPGAGRERLRTALSRLRRQIGPDLVLRDGADVVLGDRVAVDATRFRDASAAALRDALGASRADAVQLLEAAVALYPGELLPHDQAAEWAPAARALLTQRHLDLLDRLAELAGGSGHLQDALRWLELGIDADPYDEQRYLTAAELLAANGRRGRALTMLQRAAAAAATLDAEPSDEIKNLERELRGRG